MSGTILISGGTGFIGSHLCRRLVAEGHEVHLLVRRTSSFERLAGVVDRVRLWEGDLLQPSSLDACLEGARAETVYCLAADTQLRHHQDDLGDVIQSMHTGLIGRMNLIRAAALSSRPPARYFIAGSLAEYGNGSAPYLETQREAPISSHAALTHYALSLGQRVPFATTVLRFALIYGPMQSKDFLVPALIDACLRGEPFTLKSVAWRDLMFVDDLIDVLHRLSDRNDVGGEVINLATGREHALADVARLVIELVGRGAVIEVENPDTGGIAHFLGDPEKAALRLGWRATTRLEDGLARTVAWHRARCAA